ncbi:MAG TPA: hypothetical protein VE616_13770 [Candidatus Udaeobacter sp.]|jgi:hypothetical protein|nr:hypothetical protein [Candidatus Udaeobacter sp.]
MLPGFVICAFAQLSKYDEAHCIEFQNHKSVALYLFGRTVQGALAGYTNVGYYTGETRAEIKKTNKKHR